MSQERNLLRTQAKRLYKHLIKQEKSAKSKRMTFNQFFKKYREAQNAQVKEPAQQEDFDFGDMVNATNINEAGIEVGGPIKVEETTEPTTQPAMESEVVGQIDVLDSISGISEAEVEDK